MTSTNAAGGRTDLVSGKNITTNLQLNGAAPGGGGGGGGGTGGGTSGVFQVADPGPDIGVESIFEIGTCALERNHCLQIAWQYQRCQDGILTQQSSVSFGDMQLSFFAFDDGNVKVFGKKSDEGSEFFYNVDLDLKIVRLCWKYPGGTGKHRILSMVQCTSSLSRNFQANNPIKIINGIPNHNVPLLEGHSVSIVSPIIFRRTTTDEIMGIMT